MTATEDRTWQGQRAREARERAVRDEIAQAAGPLSDLVRQCLADTGDDTKLAVLLLAARLDLHTAPAIEPPRARPYVPQMSERRAQSLLTDALLTDALERTRAAFERTRRDELTSDRTQGPVLR